MNFRRQMIAAAVTATTAVAIVIVAAPGASAAPSHKPIPHTKPNWLDSGETTDVGAAPAAAAVSARVYLAPQGGIDALKDAALAVSTPGSATYHQFLTPEQYRAQFGPTADTVAAVETYLASAGLSVTGVESSNRYITVSGTVAAAQQAFGVSIQKFDHDGQEVQAPTSDVTLPDSVADSVLTVTGLDTTAHQMAPPPAGFRNARPCSISYGQIAATFMADFKTPLPAFDGATLPYAPCGYTGPQFRAAYEGNTALDGSGVTVAITDAYASPTIAADANTYAVQHGDGAYRPGQLTQVTPGSFKHAGTCDPSGWYSEETLDVEAVHAMATGANIRYYASASCFDEDFLDTLNRVVDEDQVQLVSNSWDDFEQNESAANIAAYEQAFLQGAEEGISFLFSSGDNGDELANSGLKQVDYPASDPYVTSVGGTSTAINGKGKLAWETGWGTMKYTLSADGKSWTPVGYLYGSGGGSSALFNQPPYQAGIVPGATRGVPDMAMDADPTTGMLIGITQTFPGSGVGYGEYRIGGTSLASPLFAGMTALTLQNGAEDGVGLLNPVIYASASSAFRDVKGRPKDAGNVRVDYANGLDPSGGLRYSVRTFNQDSSLKITRGWDDVTGVGSPTSAWLTAVS